MNLEQAKKIAKEIPGLFKRSNHPFGTGWKVFHSAKRWYIATTADRLQTDYFLSITVGKPGFSLGLSLIAWDTYDVKNPLPEWYWTFPKRKTND